MRVDLFRPREYAVVWPSQDPPPDSDALPIPDGEKIKISCRLLSHKSKRRVEDAMVSMKGSRLQRSSRAKDVSQMELSYSIGTIKELQLKESVRGWEGVEDKEGNLVKFTWESFVALLDCNAGLDSDSYGMLESDLIDRIERENSFADTARATGGQRKN